MNPKPLNAILFGGCLLQRPIRQLFGNGVAIPSQYLPIRETHSFGEMQQIVEAMTGSVTIPAELQPLCVTAPEGVHEVSGVDIALIEPSSPVDILFRGIVMNRQRLRRIALDPLTEGSRDAYRLAWLWMKKGLYEMNDEIRERSAAGLLDLITDGTPNASLSRDLITETRSTRSDLVAGFDRMKELLRCPIGVLLYVFSYMQDGRPITWPANFRDDVIAAASQCGLEIFDPAPLVREFGVERALKDDSKHYSDAFLPTIGPRLIEFARRVHCPSTTDAI